jgi:hypothetical protein
MEESVAMAALVPAMGEVLVAMGEVPVNGQEELLQCVINMPKAACLM